MGAWRAIQGARWGGTPAKRLRRLGDARTIRSLTMTRHRVTRMAASAVMVMVTATAVVGAVGAPVAAATDAPGTSLAGSYFMAVYNRQGFVIPAGPLTLKRDGHFTLGLEAKGGHGTWHQSADVVTLTGEGIHIRGLVFTAHVHGASLGSRAHPGEVTYEGHRFAKWYALPCASPASHCP